MNQEPSGASPRGNPPDLSVGRKVSDVYSCTPEQIAAMWDAYQKAPDDTPVKDLRALMEKAAEKASPARIADHVRLDKRSADALIAQLEQVNRNILDEASRIAHIFPSNPSSYDSLLGEAAGVRMALRFIREAVGYPTEHRLTAENCTLARGSGYPISSGDVCKLCAHESCTCEQDEWNPACLEHGVTG